ncbi:hypothetical protein Nepgr_001012 [Nepenthes gracilis]|uniref:BZIP domain-containing protein n=1 Tax=Nepenthes gracilis TaxID=150966 RepID=A0AAD3P4F9_NEPGR|nr:hypothetical protein Nepgr_001012 [Nepenthes gracilis]
MDQKQLESSATVGGSGNIKPSTELDLEELLRKTADYSYPPNIIYNSSGRMKTTEGKGGTERGGVFDDVTDGIFGVGDNHKIFDGVSTGDLGFGFPNRDIVNGFPTCVGPAESPLSQSLTPKQPCVSATLDSQSSICASSLISTHKPKAMGTASGSSPEQSDDEDAELEADPCVQSTDCIDLKRDRRKASNRDSARRSRKRKQAHLADLELQVDQLSGENLSLYKQLTEATQQLQDASTNNRVLKSDVEALRAKVKLAEDMVTRGSLSCSLNHLLQSHLSLPPQLLNSQNLQGVTHASPTISVQGDDDTSFAGIAVPSTIANGNVDTVNGDAKCGVVSDVVGCVSEIWPWGSQVFAATSK